MVVEKTLQEQRLESAQRRLDARERSRAIASTRFSGYDAQGNPLATVNGQLLSVDLISNGSIRAGEAVLSGRGGGEIFIRGRENFQSSDRRRVQAIGGGDGSIIVDPVDPPPPPPDPTVPPPSSGTGLSRGTWVIDGSGGSYSGGTFLPGSSGTSPTAPPEGSWADTIPASSTSLLQLSREFAIPGGTRIRSIILNAAPNASPLMRWSGDRSSSQFGTHPGRALLDLYLAGLQNSPSIPLFGQTQSALFSFVQLSSGIRARRSTNGGQSWTILENVPGAPTGLDFEPGFLFTPRIAATGSTVIIADSYNFVGGQNLIFRSIDNGNSWTQIQLPYPTFPERNPLEIVPGTGQNWAIAYNDRIAISQDNGATWSTVLTPPTMDGTAPMVDWLASGLILATNKGQTWTLSGTTWTQSINPGYSANPPYTYQSMIAANTEALVVRGDYQGIRLNGSTWSIVSLI